MKITPAAFCALLALASPALAQTFSLSGDWKGSATFDPNNTPNPNGPWSYGFRDNTNTFQPLPGDGLDTYGSSNGSQAFIYKNLGSAEAYGTGPGQVSLEADYGTPDARFTFPSSGNFVVNIAIGGNQANDGPGFGNNDASRAVVLLNGTSIPVSQTDTSNGLVLNWNLSQSFAAGDILDAYLPQQFIGGNTQVIFTVTTSAPEPASLSLLALTLPLLLKRRRATNAS